MAIQRGADNDPGQITQILHRFSGKIAYDVGGNVGDTAKIFASNFERVISFEPAEESYRELAVLNLPNVEAYQLAVSSHDGAVSLAVQENPIKTGQLTSATEDGRHWGRVLGTRTVPCATIDRLVDEHGVPDFIKIDVEGHEVKVIQGALDTLEVARPALYIEVHNADLGRQITDLISDWYPNLREVRHPYHQPGHWGFDNHFWLTTT